PRAAPRTGVDSSPAPRRPVPPEPTLGLAQVRDRTPALRDIAKKQTAPLPAGARRPFEQDGKGNAVGAAQVLEVDLDRAARPEQGGARSHRLRGVADLDTAGHPESGVVLALQREGSFAHELPFCFCSMASRAFSPWVSRRTINSSRLVAWISADTWFR